MASSQAASLVARGLVASPWFWGGLAAFFLGLVVGMVIARLGRRLRGHVRGIIGARRQGGGKGLLEAASARRPAARGFPVAIVVWASLAILAGAAFLVFPDKAEAFTWPVLAWSLALAACGLVVGRFPRAGGAAFLVALLALCGFVWDSTRGYVSFAGPVELARLLPLSGSGGSWLAEFMVHGRDGLPVAQHLEFEGDAASLVVDRLDLLGPSTMAGYRHFYRIAGLADASGRLVVDFHPRRNFVEGLRPLDALKAQAAFLLRRSRVTSAALPLVALQPLAFSLEADESARPAAASGVSAGSGAGPVGGAEVEAESGQAGSQPASGGFVLESRTVPVEGLGD